MPLHDSDTVERMKIRKPSCKAKATLLDKEDERYRREIENAMQVQSELLRKVEEAHEKRIKRILGCSKDEATTAHSSAGLRR